jgi:hypothetical protein
VFKSKCFLLCLEKAGMTMAPTEPLIFGSPEADAEHCHQSSFEGCLERPKRKRLALVHGPKCLQKWYGSPADLVQDIAVVATLAAKAGSGSDRLTSARLAMGDPGLRRVYSCQTSTCQVTRPHQQKGN